MENKLLTFDDYGTLTDAVIAAELANKATDLQIQLGKVIATSIVMTPLPNAATRDMQLAAHTFASALDFSDGLLKNMAVKKASKVLFGQELDIRHNKPNTRQWYYLEMFGIKDEPRKDEQGDKDYFKKVMGTLIVREYTAGHTKTAAVLAMNLGVSLGRDTLKNKDRDFAEQHKLETHAKKWGKAKTFTHRLGMGVTLSRAGDYAVGRAIGSTVISVGTIFGLHDFRLYHRNIKHEKARMGL